LSPHWEITFYMYLPQKGKVHPGRVFRAGVPVNFEKPFDSRIYVVDTFVVNRSSNGYLMINFEGIHSIWHVSSAPSGRWVAAGAAKAPRGWYFRREIFTSGIPLAWLHAHSLSYVGIGVTVETFAVFDLANFLGRDPISFANFSKGQG
jgi:hypothetical protein